MRPPASKIRILYTGIDVNAPFLAKHSSMSILHVPLIKIVKREPLVFSNDYDLLLFTSKTAVRLFATHPDAVIRPCIAVGQATSELAKSFGFPIFAVSTVETAEGIAQLIDTLLNTSATPLGKIFWPRSARARSVLTNFLKERKLTYFECIFYDTEVDLSVKVPDLEEFDAIHFTSPSTVDAYLSIYKSLPHDKAFSTIGPVTAAYLEKKFLVDKYPYIQQYEIT